MNRNRDELPLDIIISAAGAAYGVSYAHMISGGRSEPLITARLLAYWLARRMTTAGLAEIARAIGRDHTTVHAGQRSAEQRRVEDAEFALVSDTVLATLMRLESAGVLTIARSCDAAEIAQRVIAEPNREATRLSVHEIVALALAVAATTPTTTDEQEAHDGQD